MLMNMCEAHRDGAVFLSGWLFHELNAIGDINVSSKQLEF